MTTGITYAVYTTGIRERQRTSPRWDTRQAFYAEVKGGETHNKKEWYVHSKNGERRLSKHLHFY